MSIPAVTAPEAERDEKLARLLNELTAELRAGRPPDLAAVCRRHPDLSGDLRELWGAVLLAEEYARSASDVRTLDSPPAAVSEATPGPLPRRVGDYELLQELGRGGMGVVYKAWQRGLGREVALKMMLRGDLASPVDQARFQAEAEAAGRLDHPHIVPVYQVGFHDGQLFFSMKYIEGTTLAARVAGGPLPSRQAVEYLLPICHAIHYAHQHGILHRDLKPSNILIDQAGQVFVTDFGLAKRVEGDFSLTRTGAIVGTPSYIPPEQALGSRGVLCPASDVYSLGAVLYEMLTGRPPFQAATPLDVVMQVLEQDLVPPRLLNPKVDRELEMICLKCLQKPIDLRYQGADELARDLEAFLRGDTEAIAARPSGMAYLVNQMFRETHHAAILENWGLLWMWHSLKIFLLCLLTNILLWCGVRDHWPYLILWTGGLLAWGWIFWGLRKRGGPVTFVERQIAHVWASGVLASIFLFLVELLLGRPVLELSPALAVAAGMVFVVKAGMLSGVFYFAAAAQFATAVLMARFPMVGLLLFGIVSAVCFFVPGLKYHRQRLRAERLAGQRAAALSPEAAGP